MKLINLAKVGVALSLMTSVVYAGEVQVDTGVQNYHYGTDKSDYNKALVEAEVLTESERDESGQFIGHFFKTIELVQEGKVNPNAAEWIALLDEEMQARIAIGEFEELTIRDIDFDDQANYREMTVAQNGSFDFYAIQGVFGVRFQRSTEGPNGDFDGGEGIVNGTYNSRFEIIFSVMEGELLTQDYGHGPEPAFELRVLNTEGSPMFLEAALSTFGYDEYSPKKMSSVGQVILSSFLQKPENIKLLTYIQEQR